jgi:DNA modification methylase
MLKINPKFKNLIPPLTPDEYKGLEQSLLFEGCRDAIVTWDDYIIDGHNRFEICEKNNIPYETIPYQIENENEVYIWIIQNQFSRRNLSNYDRSLLALKLKSYFQEKAKENLISSGENYGKGLQKSANPIEKVDTREELSKIAGVSHDTIQKVEKIEEMASPEIKEKVRSGEISINQAYKETVNIDKTNLLEQRKAEYLNKYNSEIENKPEIKLCSAKEYLKTFENNSIDLLITDPPYITDIQNIEIFLNEWLELAILKTKKFGRIYICSGAYPEEIYSYLKILLNQKKFIVDNPLIWTYRNTLGVTPKMKYNLNYQIIWHLYSENSTILDTSITNEMFSVMDINAPDGRQGDRLHTWQKPDELANRLIRHSSKENDLIVDCFCGTGTFLLSAAKQKRIAKGCDISEENLLIAQERGCIIIG